MRCLTWRHQPAARRSGISHVPNARATTDTAATRLRVASTAGARSMSAIRAPATAVIAVAPIAIQYGGANSAGLGLRRTSAAATARLTPAYRTRPVDQDATASNASSRPAAAVVGSIDAASTATECAP